MYWERYIHAEMFEMHKNTLTEVTTSFNPPKIMLTSRF